MASRPPAGHGTLGTSTCAAGVEGRHGSSAVLWTSAGRRGGGAGEAKGQWWGRHGGGGGLGGAGGEGREAGDGGGVSGMTRG
jgi:hypothetical protein